MPGVQYPYDIGAEIVSLRRRIELLERMTGVASTTVINDLAGTTRVGIGQLDKIFPSAGYNVNTYGLRVQDVSGNGILDTIGLQQVATVIGTATDGSNVYSPSTGWTDIGTAATFTLSRPGYVLCLSTLQCYATGGSNGSIRLQTIVREAGVQQNSSNQMIHTDTNSSGASVQNNFGTFIIPTPLAAGSYSLITQASASASGMTLGLYQQVHVVVQMGG